MGRPAISRFGRFGLVGCIAIGACWSGKGASQDTAIDNRAQPLEARDLSGAYWCSIVDDGYTYPRFPCAIRRIQSRFVLAKLGGSQRFTGEVKPISGGALSFSGQFYCPWGDCTQELHGVFKPALAGALRGTFRDARMIVMLVPAADAAFGGAAYGGDGYGGFGYGGATYGRRP